MSKNLYISSLLDIYGRFLSQKQKDLAEYYYNDDLSLAEIAENEGLTRQGVRDTIRRAQEQLAAYEARLHMAQTFRTLSQKAALLLSLADEAERGSEAQRAKALERIRAAALELQNLG